MKRDGESRAEAVRVPRRGPARAVLIAAVVAVLFTASDAGAFQVLRLLGGLRTIEGVTRIAAACVQQGQHVPERTDMFAGSNVPILAREVTTTGPGPWRPADELLTFRGTGLPTAVDVEPRTPGVKVELNIPTQGNVAIGETARDAKRALADVPLSIRQAFTTLDDLQRRVGNTFGSDSRIARDFGDHKQRFEWLLEGRGSATPADTQEFLDNFADSYESFADETTFARIAAGTADGVDTTSAAFRGKVKSLLKIELPATISSSVLDAVAAFKRNRAELGRAFGADTRWVAAYEEAFNASYAADSGKGLAPVHESFLESLDDEYGAFLADGLRKTRSRTDLLSLAMGRRLDAQQASVLSQTTGLPFAAPTNAFANHVIVSRQLSGIVPRAHVKSIGGSDSVALRELPAALSGKSVIVDGPVDARMAQSLYDSGVVSFRNLRSLMQEPEQRVQRVRFIMASSRIPQEAASIWQIHNADAIVTLTNRAAGKLGAEIVANESQLRAAIKKAHDAGERVVVIAHNDEGGFAFASRLAFDDLNEPTVYVLTCSSFNTASPFLNRTTAELDLESMLAALERVASRFPNGATGEEYMGAFNREYADEVKRTRKVEVGSVVAITATGSAVLAIVVSVASKASGAPRCDAVDGGCGDAQ